MKFRRILFWTHLAAGAAAGLVILLMSVTGVVLTYEAQWNEWARRDYRSERAAPAPLTADRLVGIAAANAPEDRTPTSLALAADPLAPAAVGLGRGLTLYLDRYSGEVRGDGDTRTRRFLRSVMYWHRWLALGGESRSAGRAVTGAANLVFLFLILSGLYLWWPRRLTPQGIRNAVRFRRGLRGRARNFNWHNAAGFWLAVPLAVIVFSGMMISYGWVRDFIEFAAGETPAAAALEPAAADADPLPRAGPSISLQALLDRAAAETPGWRRLTLRLPGEGEPDAPYTVRADTGAGRQPAHWRNLRFDRRSGDLLGVFPATEGRAQAVRYWLRFAHTGEVYGLAGQTAALVATAGGALLVWTGFAMAWRRFFPEKRKAPPESFPV